MPTHVAAPEHVQVNMHVGSPGRRPPTQMQLDIIRRQRQAMRRQGSYSDVVNGTKCASPIKVFQYGWHVLIILLGLGLLCLGLYFLYYQENAHMVPTLAYNLATYTGLALALMSILGLYGLQQQRRCITEGRRNYPLGIYILLGAIGAFVIIMGGVIALTLRRVADAAESDDYTQARVMHFETAVLTLLHDYVKASPGGWRGIQNSMYCCGYGSVSALRAHVKGEWDPAVLGKVSDINAVMGSFCAKKKADCPGVDGYPCPARDRGWCRTEVLASIVANYNLLGIYAIVIGSCQILSVVLAVFTLLCDVRMLRPRSPALELPRFALKSLRWNRP